MAHKKGNRGRGGIRTAASQNRSPRFREMLRLEAGREADAEAARRVKRRIQSGETSVVKFVEKFKAK